VFIERIDLVCWFTTFFFFSFFSCKPFSFPFRSSSPGRGGLCWIAFDYGSYFPEGGVKPVHLFFLFFFLFFFFFPSKFFPSLSFFVLRAARRAEQGVKKVVWLESKEQRWVLGTMFFFPLFFFFFSLQGDLFFPPFLPFLIGTHCITLGQGSWVKEDQEGAKIITSSFPSLLLFLFFLQNFPLPLSPPSANGPGPSRKGKPERSTNLAPPHSFLSPSFFRTDPFPFLLSDRGRGVVI